MSGSNPYQAPETALRSPDEDWKESLSDELAGRWVRLGARLLDVLFILLVLLPVMWWTGYLDAEPDLLLDLIWTLTAFFLFAVINFQLLSRRGQSIGKLICRIRITDLNARKISVSTILLRRELPLELLSSLPLVGNWIWLEVLLIFKEDRRCGHDLWADTKVVRVPS